MRFSSLVKAIHRISGGTRKARKQRQAMLDRLESRMLLSVNVAANGKSATWTDVDGDQVKLAVTKGTLLLGSFTSVAQGLGDLVTTIDLTGGGFAGSNVTVTVKRVAPGDGSVNIGYINSTLQDLGTVSIPGDLGSIDAGDATAATPGIKSLTVRSMGQVGLDSQNGGGDLKSDINTLGSLTVKGNVFGARIEVTGDISGINVSGSILGDGFADSGAINATGNIGAVKVGFDIQGGEGTRSGTITADGAIKSVTIGGSLVGGDGSVSGVVRSDGDMGAVKITGDIRGSTGNNSGVIDSGAKLTSATVGGSLIGGAGDGSSNIFSNGDIGAVKITGSLIGVGTSSALIIGLANIANITIGGSLQGSDGDTSASILSSGNIGATKITGSIVGGGGLRSGIIEAAGDIQSLTIGGTLQGGGDESSGSVLAGGDIGAIKITGSVVGGGGLRSGGIDATGDIKSIAIGGSLVGGDGNLSGLVTADGNIGATTITGSVIGGDGDSSGHLTADNEIKSVKISRDIIGGSGEFSGVVDPDINLPTITVGGSVVGGLGDNSGMIASNNLGTVKITGSLVGGSVEGVDSAQYTGVIRGNTAINSVAINGSIVAGLNSGAGTLLGSGAIFSANDIKSITVKGNLVGNVTNPVLIVARGQAAPTASKDEAIGTVSVTGRMEYTTILAGFDATLAEVNGDAQINTIKIGTDFIASVVRAGTALGADTLPATNDDGIIPGGGAPISIINSVTIGGLVFGTPDSVDNGDHFGFSAQRIAAVKINGKAITLNPVDDTDNIDIGATGDVSILEP